jgi:hypothetical protein
MAEANRVYINFKYDKEVRKRIYKEQQFGEIRQGLLLELFPNLNGVPFEVTYMDNEKTVIRVTDEVWIGPPPWNHRGTTVYSSSMKRTTLLLQLLLLLPRIVLSRMKWWNL